MPRRRTAVTTVVAACALAACSAGSGPAAAPTPAATGPQPPVSVPSPTNSVEYGSDPSDSGDRPAPFRVRTARIAVELHSYGYCYQDTCVDGAPGEIPTVGVDGRVLVYADPDHWERLSVTQFSGRSTDSVATHPAMTRLGRGWWRVDPATQDHVYRVALRAETGGESMDAALLLRPSD